MCRCQPISALTSKVHQTTTPNMQRCQTCLTRATSSTPAFQWHFLVARQPWSIFACMNSCRQKRVRLLRCVRSASSTKHCGRAAETFATLLSQPLTRLWHRDVLGLPVPSMFVASSLEARASPASIVAPICLDRSVTAGSPPNTAVFICLRRSLSPRQTYQLRRTRSPRLPSLSAGDRPNWRRYCRRALPGLTSHCPGVGRRMRCHDI